MTVRTRKRRLAATYMTNGAKSGIWLVYGENRVDEDSFIVNLN
jgi:hypothetical protein